MAFIVAFFTTDGAPATGLSPTVRIRRTDTGALVETDTAMTELGDGGYARSFVPSPSLEYAIRADKGSGNDFERYVYGYLSGAEADPSAIADAVWDEALAGHGTLTTTGGAMTLLLGALRNAQLDTSNSAQWVILVKDPADDNTVLLTMNLDDQDGNAINDANPIQGTFVANKEPV